LFCARTFIHAWQCTTEQPAKGCETKNEWAKTKSEVNCQRALNQKGIKQMNIKQGLPVVTVIHCNKTKLKI
jgi:hypothetical protein